MPVLCEVLIDDPERSHETLCARGIAVPFPDRPLGFRPVPAPRLRQLRGPHAGSERVGTAAGYAAHGLRPPSGLGAFTRAVR
jgi:hypothetical protein